MYGIHKELKKTKQQEINDTVKNWALDLNTVFRRRNANNLTLFKKCSNIIFSWGKRKLNLLYILNHFVKAPIHWENTTNAGEDVGIQKALLNVSRSVDSLKLQIQLPHDKDASLLGIYPNDPASHDRDNCPSMLFYLP